MAVRWEVTYLTIAANDVVLFANGQMQVAAHVLIRAINPVNNNPYTLTATELNRIELIDYYNPGTRLAGGWTYTATENEFAHSMPGSSDAISEGIGPRNNQIRTWWVSTTNIEAKSVGARISQPDGRWINTHSDAFDSHVILRGTAPVVYSKSNTEFERHDTANGSRWDQDNYYLSSNVYPFKRSDPRGFQPDTYPIEGLRRSYGFHRAGTIGNFRNIHYMWPMGPQTTVRAGVTHTTTGAWISGSTQTITIRERPQAMCFTRLFMEVFPDPYTHGWAFSSTTFRIFDLYGNSGNFSMSTGDRNNLITLMDRNTLAIEGSLSDDVIREQEDVPDEEII